MTTDFIDPCGETVVAQLHIDEAATTGLCSSDLWPWDS